MMMPAGDPWGQMGGGMGGMYGGMYPPQYPPMAPVEAVHHHKHHKDHHCCHGIGGKVLKVLSCASGVASVLWLLDWCGVIDVPFPEGLDPKPRTTTLPPSPSPPGPPTPKATAAFVSGVDGLCLDLAGNAESDGAPLQGYPCDPTAPAPSQRWFVDSKNQIIHKTEDGQKFCLDLPDNNHGNGAPLQIWSCAGSPQQRWRVESDLIRTDDGTKCVSINADDPSRVQLLDCAPGDPTQIWMVKGLPDYVLA
jgi:hypothetical protein